MRGVAQIIAGVVAGLVTLGVPLALTAEPITFSVHRGSQATFRTDAPLETVVGTTAGAGVVTGALTVDLAKPREATGSIRVDLSTLKTGVERRDAAMLSAEWLDVQHETNRYAVFEMKAVDVSGPLEPGRELPAKVRGTLTIKGKPVETLADARVTYVKLSPADAEAQKRSGFTPEVLRVRARFETKFTNHGMQVPQFYLLRVSNEIQVDADLIFVRP